MLHNTINYNLTNNRANKTKKSLKSNLSSLIF